MPVWDFYLDVFISYVVIYISWSLFDFSIPCLHLYFHVRLFISSAYPFISLTPLLAFPVPSTTESNYFCFFPPFFLCSVLIMIPFHFLFMLSPLFQFIISFKYLVFFHLLTNFLLSSSSNLFPQWDFILWILVKFIHFIFFRFFSLASFLCYFSLSFTVFVFSDIHHILYFHLILYILLFFSAYFYFVFISLLIYPKL